MKYLLPFLPFFLGAATALDTSITSDAEDTAVPTLGSSCTGSESYCGGSIIIYRCEDGEIVAGNCNDNLDEPEYGASCVETEFGAAKCVANSAPASTTAIAVMTVTSVATTAKVTKTTGVSTTDSTSAVVATVTTTSSVVANATTTVPVPASPTGGASVRGVGFAAVLGAIAVFVYA